MGTDLNLHPYKVAFETQDSELLRRRRSIKVSCVEGNPKGGRVGGSRSAVQWAVMIVTNFGQGGLPQQMENEPINILAII